MKAFAFYLPPLAAMDLMKNIIRVLENNQSSYFGLDQARLSAVEN